MAYQKTNEKKNFLWNMIGSGVCSIASMLLSLFVINLVGPEEGGVIAIAVTLSQMFVYIAYFEIRTYLVTDASNEFLFAEYHTTKIVTCILMMLVSFGYVFVNNFNTQKAIIILLMCVARCLDGYADVYEAEFQRIGRLDLAGKSLAYRTIVFTGGFIVLLALTKATVLSLVLADAFAVIGVFVFDVMVMKHLQKVECKWDRKKIVSILTKCLPLFIGVFCWTYILSASRIAIDGNMSSEYQSYYQVIFMPVSVINLFSSFVFRPLLPKLSETYSEGKYRQFIRLVGKGILWIGIFTGICMAGAWMLGIPVLSIMSGCDLQSYRGILVFLIFAGGFNAVAFTMYYVLTIMRCTKSLLIDYIFAAVLSYAISGPMVIRLGILGAAVSYFVVVVVLCILFLGAICKRMSYKKKEENRKKVE